MAGKSKSKVKDMKASQNEPAAFVLPDSLPSSEIEFPTVVKKKPKANWKDILRESDYRRQEIQAYADSKKEFVPKSPFLKTEPDYIKNEVFVLLIPALEETLNKAKIWEALTIQKCFFNGIDHVVQLLWNNNPRYPARQIQKLHVFNMPWVRAYLKENPRPYYPKSWLWPEEYAATLIQKTVRQYYVQREEEVHEMRDFWQRLEVERNNPHLDTNPYLAKKFASNQIFTPKN